MKLDVELMEEPSTPAAGRVTEGHRRKAWRGGKSHTMRRKRSEGGISPQTHKEGGAAVGVTCNGGVAALLDLIRGGASGSEATQWEWRGSAGLAVMLIIIWFSFPPSFPCLGEPTHRLLQICFWCQALFLSALNRGTGKRRELMWLFWCGSDKPPLNSGPVRSRASLWGCEAVRR